MDKTGIGIIDRIVDSNPGAFVSRSDWMRHAVTPVFTHSGFIRNRTIDGMEQIQSFVSHLDSAAAVTEWKSIVARHRRLANGMQPLVTFVTKSRHFDIVFFVRKLRSFFIVDDDDFVRPNELYYRAIKGPWAETLRNGDIDNRPELTETVKSEMLHIQLKWAMLQNDFIFLQSDNEETSGNETT